MTDGWVAVDDVSLTGPTVTKYYYLGSQRVAMRQGGVLTYLHGDHGHAQHGLQRQPCYQCHRRESERAALPALRRDAPRLHRERPAHGSAIHRAKA